MWLVVKSNAAETRSSHNAYRAKRDEVSISAETKRTCLKEVKGVFDIKRFGNLPFPGLAVATAAGALAGHDRRDL